jgi:hypothetical protein
MEKEKLSSLRERTEGMVGSWLLREGEDNRDDVPDVPRSMYFPFILLINIIAQTTIDCNDHNALFEIDLQY